MGVDFSTLVYAPNFDMWARTVYFTPVASQGRGVVAYKARGIYQSSRTNVPLDDGSFLSDQDTILDIRAAEFPIPPQQGDLVNIPADVGAMPAEGDFQVDNVWNNGGGEITLQLRQVMTAL